MVNGSLSGKTGESKLERIGMGKADTKLERWVQRRTSQRLESDATSTTSLRNH